MEIGETVVFEASMGLQNLQHEPNRLLSEADRLNAELESLVMDNYRIFVENLTCSVHLRTEVCISFHFFHLHVPIDHEHIFLTCTYIYRTRNLENVLENWETNCLVYSNNVQHFVTV